MPKRFALGLDGVDIIAARGFFGLFDGGLKRRFFLAGKFGAMLAQRFFRHMDQCVALVACFGKRVRLLVFLGVLLGILHHALHFFLGQPAGGLDADFVFLAGRLVLGRDVQDAIGVDVKGDFDLRHAARRRRNVGQVELAETLVAGSHLALALQNVDGHRRLVIVGRREDL